MTDFQIIVTAMIAGLMIGCTIATAHSILGKILS